jgi:hypothetical protein
MGYTSQPDPIFTMPPHIGPMWVNSQPLTARRHSAGFGIILLGGNTTTLSHRLG